MVAGSAGDFWWNDPVAIHFHIFDLNLMTSTNFAVKHSRGLTWLNESEMHVGLIEGKNWDERVSMILDQMNSGTCPSSLV